MKLFLTYNSTVIGKTEKQNAILACKHFKASHHNFQRDAKFKLIEKIKKPEQQNRTVTTYSKKKTKKLWILELKPLHPGCLNQELNDV